MLKQVSIFLVSLIMLHTLIPGVISIRYDIKTESQSIALNKPCCCEPQACDCNETKEDECDLPKDHPEKKQLRSMACSDLPWSQGFAFSLKKQWIYGVSKTNIKEKIITRLESSLQNKGPKIYLAPLERPPQVG